MMEPRVDLSADGTGLRRGLREETRYAFVHSVDWRAFWIAAAAPLVATLMVLSAL